MGEQVGEEFSNKVADYETTVDYIDAFDSDRHAQLAYAPEGARGGHGELHRP